MRTVMGLMCGLLLVCWSGTSALAQGVDPNDREQSQSKAGDQYQKGTSHQPTIKNGVMMKDGKVYEVKDGKLSELTSETTLDNGWKVNNDGTINVSGGHNIQLKDGMAVDEKGKIRDHTGRVITRAEAERAYKSAPSGHEGMQGGVMARDGIMMRHGKVWQIKNGKSTEVTQEVTLNNGWKVNNDGRVQMANGKTMQLKDGEILDMKGKIVRAGKKHMDSMQGGMQRMDSTEMGKPEPR